MEAHPLEDGAAHVAAEQQLVDEFLELFTGRINRALALLMEMQNQAGRWQDGLNDIVQLQKAVEEFYIQRLMSQQSFTNGVAHFVVSLALCRVLYLLGCAKTGVGAEVEGYLCIEAACERLETMQQTKNALGREQFALPQTSSTRPYAKSPSFFIGRGGERRSFIGSAMLLECVLNMGKTWSAWGEMAVCKDCFAHAHEIYNAVRGAKRQAKTTRINALVLEGKELASTLEAHRAEQCAQQQKQFEAKLAARRKGRNQPPTVEDDAPAVRQSPERQEEERAAIEVRLPSLDWCCMNASSDSCLSKMHTADLEVPKALDNVLVDVAAGLAAVSTAQNDSVAAAHYSHLSLQLRLQFKDCNVTEWIATCLDLAGFYHLVLDLSHSQHCIEAVEFLMSGGIPPAVDGTRSTENARATVDLPSFTFLRACQAYHTLKLLAKTAEVQKQQAQPRTASMSLDGQDVKLFLNPAYVPENLRNLPTARHRAVVVAKKPVVAQGGDWCSPVRIAFSVLPISPPREVLHVSDTPMVIDNLFKTLNQHLDAVVDSSFTVETNCERYLESLRMRIDALGVMHSFTGKVDFLRRRLDELERIYSVKLNANAFRNVLRQADFDSGISAQLIAENVTDPMEKERYLRLALKYFLTFGDAFRAEISAGRREHVDDVLEGSDFPAFVVGELRTVQLLIQLDMHNEATAKLQAVLSFLDANTKAVKEYPELADHRQLAQELLITLLSRQGVRQKASAKQQDPAKRAGAAKSS